MVGGGDASVKRSGDFEGVFENERSRVARCCVSSPLVEENAAKGVASRGQGQSTTRLIPPSIVSAVPVI